MSENQQQRDKQRELSDTITAIRQFLNWGESAFERKEQGGYFSGGGWAAVKLRNHVVALEAEYDWAHAAPDLSFQPMPAMGTVHYEEKMTMRDKFAAKALGGMHARDGFDSGQATPDQRARLAYIDADAMLRARTAQSPRATQQAHIDEAFGKA